MTWEDTCFSDNNATANMYLLQLHGVVCVFLLWPLGYVSLLFKSRALPDIDELTHEHSVLQPWKKEISLDQLRL